MNTDFFDIPVEFQAGPESIFDIFLPEIITRNTKRRSFALIFGGKKSFLLGFRKTGNISFKDVFSAKKSFSDSIPSSFFPEQWFKDCTALCEIAKFNASDLKGLCKNRKTLEENLKNAILENQETNCLFFTDFYEEKIVYSFVFFRLDNTRPNLSSLKQNAGESFFQNRIFSQKKLRSLENPFIKEEFSENTDFDSTIKNQSLFGKNEKISVGENNTENCSNSEVSSKNSSDSAALSETELDSIIEKISSSSKIACASGEIKNRVSIILKSSKHLLERKDVCSMIILALASEESIFLFGPPGTAKSMTAKWAETILGTHKTFSCLLNQYTQPDELFGPVSIKDLEDGSYKRLCQGYLPESKIVFLDEIWKAGPAILNTLLTVSNEKIFKNGNEIKSVPLELLISASNELPSEDSGLEPLYDRFLIRLLVTPLSEKENFLSLLLSDSNSESKNEKEFQPVSEKELLSWKNGKSKIKASKKITDLLWTLRLCLQKDERYISDRRWKKSFELMKASAFLNGRDEIDLSDFSVLSNTLWNLPEEIQETKILMAEKLVESYLYGFRNELSEVSFINLLAGSSYEKIKDNFLSIFRENIFVSEDFLDECETQIEKQSIKSGMESFKKAFKA